MLRRACDAPHVVVVVVVVVVVACCPAVCLVAPPNAGAVAKNDVVPRLVAFGDMHGDIFSCRQVLQAANITDGADRWIAGASTVVQLGDIADRGRHYHEIYDLFASLEQQAAAAGGEFTFVVGNHELLNLVGDHRYAHPDVVAVFGGQAAYAAAFSPWGAYGSYILQHHVVAVREGVAFVHAGVTPAYAAMGVHAINAEFQRGFHRGAGEGNGDGHPFNSNDSPLWTRNVLREAHEGNCTLVEEALHVLSLSEVAAGRASVRVMVGGHTIQPDGSVTIVCDGQLVAADVGLSRYLQLAGGHVAYVEFLHDESVPARRVPVPQYPFGKGKRPTTPPMLSEPVRLPRRALWQQQPQEYQGPGGPNGNNNRNTDIRRATPSGVAEMTPVSVAGETPNPLLDCFILCLMLALLVSLVFVRVWRPFAKGHHSGRKVT
ncbi:putative serine/threonine protein phosphatase [Trypanosoma grayi]|uniref:putative serine/threonine protein phosphatase n=1 Tax=Trypanosoma grayi TaxID=71804 RepID=UPI0004F4B858|nr:putative serine/threonine protein phosphatase [Trypanosoma grayi]KEG14907.1 putative serine/threonine protein phosphatase [Trypanosoma grayi]